MIRLTLIGATISTLPSDAFGLMPAGLSYTRAAAPPLGITVDDAITRTLILKVVVRSGGGVSLARRLEERPVVPYAICRLWMVECRTSPHAVFHEATAFRRSLEVCRLPGDECGEWVDL